MAKIRSIQDVTERHMCTGCGVCAYMQPDAVRMVDDLGQGRRPLVEAGSDTREALQACPGIELAHDYDPNQPGLVRELEEHWGPVLEMWEGYAADDEIRWLGSSGGAATALSLFALQELGFHGVLHVGAREDVPWLNRTILSRSREDLIGATGSRYAPASPGDGLAQVQAAPGPCLMVGKPCDIAGARRAAQLRPELDEKLGLTIAIFCAGAPSTQGTLDLMEHMGFPTRGQVDSLRYRGKGWPGGAEISGLDGAQQARTARMSYAESWGKILQKNRPWRCYVCADHTGEFADIAVGDPWYREIPEGEPGRSLILARTERGRQFLEQAMAAGVLEVEPAAAHLLPDSQMNLLRTRGVVWGRSWASRLFGVAAPRLVRLATFSAWRRHLSWKARAQSFYGTFKRVFSKGLYKRRPVQPVDMAALVAERQAALAARSSEAAGGVGS